MRGSNLEKKNMVERAKENRQKLRIAMKIDVHVISYFTYLRANDFQRNQIFSAYFYVTIFIFLSDRSPLLPPKRCSGTMHRALHVF